MRILLCLVLRYDAVNSVLNQCWNSHAVIGMTAAGANDCTVHAQHQPLVAVILVMDAATWG